MAAACALAPSRTAPGAWAEMVAPLANMAESALAGVTLTAAGEPPACPEVSSGDPRRVEGNPRSPGAHGDRVCPSVHPDAGPRAHRIHRPPVRPGRPGSPAGLRRQRHRGDRRRPGPV